MAKSASAEMARRRLEVLAAQFGSAAELLEVLPQLEKLLEALERLEELGLDGVEPATTYWPGEE